MVASACSNAQLNTKKHCFIPPERKAKLKLVHELSCFSHHTCEQHAYLVGGFVWDPRPGPALLHSASECGWRSRHLPRGGSAPLLNWLLWACLPLCASVSCMTAGCWAETRRVTHSAMYLRVWQFRTSHHTGKVHAFTHNRNKHATVEHIESVKLTL